MWTIYILANLWSSYICTHQTIINHTICPKLAGSANCIHVCTYVCKYISMRVCITCRLGLQSTIVWRYSCSFANIIVLLVPGVRCPKPQTGACAHAFTHSLSHWSFFLRMFYLWASKLLVLVTALGPFYFILFTPAHNHVGREHTSSSPELHRLCARGDAMRFWLDLAFL